MTDRPSHRVRGGLSTAEAAARLASDGPNALPSGRHRSFPGIVFGVLQEPMLLLLIAAGMIYLLLGDLHDALILVVFAGLTIAIAVVQETRTERAIEALQDLSMPQAVVVRDGMRRTIPSIELVCGDLLVVSEGGRVGADGWIVEADSLQVDEAILTGESVAVTKSATDEASSGAPPLPGGDGVPYAYSGTLVVKGTGLVRVSATGAETRIGEIGQFLALLEAETPRLVVQTRRLVRWFAVAGLGVSLLAVVLYRWLRGGWLDALLSGIALAMSLLPEEMPIVLTLFMTMGALRMSRSRALARRGTAIETLGAATVLCTDKTGTLTENRMEVAELRLPDGASFRPMDSRDGVPDEFLDLAQVGILACPEKPFDPMEKAFHALADRHPRAAPGRYGEGGWSLHHHYAFGPELLATSQVWTSDRQDGKLVAAKGAPEAIADLCGLGPGERQAIEVEASRMADTGLRVLGIARAVWTDAALPGSQRHFAFSFLGLVGLADPVRPAVPRAVRELQDAGIRVVMVTGDYPATARAIAGQAGIAPGEVMTGDEIGRQSDTELAQRIGAVAVFARVMPEQKLRIVRALKAAGEVVAMTGDGVNDAPSLKAAHIGIAMGQRGTDVAREASSLVLLDDDFGTIATAVRLGRRIYDNIRKATGFILAVHLPIGGIAIAPLLTGWPLILGPVHIALLEMVIDPVCSLSFEAEQEEEDIMRRNPRPPESTLVSRGLAVWAALQGLLALVLLLVLAFWANQSGMGEEQVRSTCFAGLVAAVLVLVLVNRSFRSGLAGHRSGHNPTFAVILAIAILFFGLLFLVPPIADLFRFAVLDGPGSLAIALTAATLAGLLIATKRKFGAALSR